MQQAAAPNFFVTGYTGAPRGRDYDRWREELCRRTLRVDYQPGEGDTIACKLQISLVGDILLGVTSGSSAEVSRTRETVKDGYDGLCLVIATAGSVPITYEGQSIELPESQMCLGDMSVIGGSRVSNACRIETVRIPRSLLLSICPRRRTGWA